MNRHARHACQRLPRGFACGWSDVGLVRESNEDSFLIDAELSLVAVADGMGGHADGALASRMALLALRDYLRAASPKYAAPGGDATIRQSHTFIETAVLRDAHGQAGAQPSSDAAGRLLHDAIAFANRQVHDHNRACDQHHGEGMGTTLTGIWQDRSGASLTLFHIGDTRLYCLRDGRLRVLTADQTHYQRALDAGELQHMPPPNLLLQALGPFAEVSADIVRLAMTPGDLYLLSSDGLHGSVPDAHIAALLRAVTIANAAQVCEELIALAKDHRSRDNITAVLIGVTA